MLKHHSVLKRDTGNIQGIEKSQKDFLFLKEKNPTSSEHVK